MKRGRGPVLHNSAAVASPVRSGGLGVNIGRHLVVETAMRASVVVDPDRLVDGTTCLQAAAELATQGVLLFEDAVQSFGVSVLVTVVFLGHADRQTSVVQDLDIVVRAVLAASIGVVDGIPILWQLSQGLAEGSEIRSGVAPLAAVVAHDLPREEVHDENQVFEAFSSSDVGDVAHPDHVRACCLEVGDQVVKHGETVTGECRSAASGGKRGHQEIAGSKHLEEAIPANDDASSFELVLEYAVELPTTEPRLDETLSSDQRDDEFFVDPSPAPLSPLLVEALPAHANFQAQSRNAYPSDSSQLFSRPPDTIAACLFLKAPGSMPCSSHRISKND